MKKWKVWVAFAAMFAAGVVVGVAGLALVLQQQFNHPMDHARFCETVRARLLADIADTVRPDPAAMPGIERTLDQTLDALEAHRAENGPKIQAILNTGKQEILSMLTPEQGVRFEQMMRDRKGPRFGFLRLPPPPPLP